jgi:hypothetical protein
MRQGGSFLSHQNKNCTYNRWDGHAVTFVEEGVRTTMSRDTLFLLKEDFADGPGLPYFCPDCAIITGVLSYFPKLRHHLDIKYVDFPRPRTEIVELIGTERQGCPVLILAKAPPMDALGYLTGQVNGHSFISGAKAIAMYWSHVYGVSRPH